MESVNIEKLLDKYFESETSIAEETILKTYFSKQNIPEHLMQYKAMFAYFEQNKTEVSKKPIQVNSKKQTWYGKSMAIAAVFLLLVAIGIKYTSYSNDKLSDAELKEAQKAYLETQKVFKLISENLNKGNNAVAYLNEYESTKNKIFK